MSDAVLEVARFHQGKPPRTADPSYVEPTVVDTKTGTTGVVTTAASVTTITLAIGDQLVLKRVRDNGSDVGTWAAPSSTGGASSGQLTWTPRATINVASKCQVDIYTSNPLTAAAAVTVSSGTTNTGQSKSMVVEACRDAAVFDGTQRIVQLATSATTGTWPDSHLLSTQADNSIVTWAAGDWGAIAPGAPAFRSGATSELVHDLSPSDYVAYFARQDAPLAGPQRIGLTTPAGGINWTVAGLEVESIQTSGSNFSGTANLTGSGTLSGSGRPAAAASTALSGSGSLSFTTTPATAGAVPLSGAGALWPAGAPATTSAATLTGGGTLGTAGLVVVIATASLTGSGLLSTTVVPRPTIAVALSGAGALGTAPTVSTSGAATLGGTGSLATTGAAAIAAASPLTGSGSLTAAGTPRPVANPLLAGAGTLTTTTTVTTSGSSPLSGSGSLSVSAGSSGSGTATLTGSGALTTTRTPALARTVALSGSGSLNASTAPATTVGVVLTGSGVLVLAARAAAQALADLTGAGLLQGGGQAAGSGVAALAGAGTLVAQPDGPAAPPMVLTVGQPRPRRFTTAPAPTTAPSITTSGPTPATTTAGRPRSSRYHVGGPT